MYHLFANCRNLASVEVTYRARANVSQRDIHTLINQIYRAVMEESLVKVHDVAVGDWDDIINLVIAFDFPFFDGYQ